MNEAPSIEDFGKKRGPGRWRTWLLELPCMIPTLAPAFGKATSTQDRRSHLYRYSALTGVKIKTTVKDGELWVLRLEEAAS